MSVCIAFFWCRLRTTCRRWAEFLRNCSHLMSDVDSTEEMADEQKQGLALLTRADRLLSKVQSLSDATELMSVAQAAQVFARKAKLGLEAQNKAAEIKIRAERIAGEYIHRLERGQGRRQDLTLGNVAQSSPYKSALETAGASRRDASRWQLMAELPQESFEAEIESAKNGGRELTTARMVKAATAHQARESKGGADELLNLDEVGISGVLRGSTGLRKLIRSDVRFKTIYVDPPWSYDNQGTRAATGNHYETMTVDEISELPVGELAAKEAHLHLWTTNAFLFECPKLLGAWGFDYKGVFVWVKPQFGIGNYWRVAHEFLILGVRGSLAFQEHGQRSWQEYSRREHSQKPDNIRDLIEQVSPGPRLELFARKQASNWVCWGDQIE